MADINENNVNTINHTYNVQDEIRRYNLKRYVKQVGTVLSKTKEGVYAEEGDPLLNYDIDGDNRITRSERQEEGDPERYYKEQRQVVNINSRFRMNRILKPIEHAFLRDHPHSDELLQKFWDSEEGIFKDIEKLVKVLNDYQADCFALVRLDAQSPLRPGRFEAISSSPSDYTFQLPKGLNNIKTLRLLSTEIPGCLPGITQDNNLILIDLVKECTCMAYDNFTNCEIEYAPDYLLPYIVVQIPPGNYGLEELAETMEDRINQSIMAYTCLGTKQLFEIRADIETDAFLISLKDCHSECDHDICHQQAKTDEKEYHKSKIDDCKSKTDDCKGTLKFRFRFCSHPRVEELSLWYLLGFPRASSPGLVTSWSNLVPIASSKHFSKVVNKRPFRPTDLTPHKYIYLAIKGFGTINDPLVDNPDLFAKIELGPKPTEATGKTLYNTFICNPKIFLETPLRLVDRLNITWIDAWGQVVDFHNQEHSLALEFVLYLDFLVDSNFSSLRGVRDQSSFTESSLRQ